MKHKLTAVILATGGIGLVRAAYSSGKPAFGVGPGNVPAMIEHTANISKAVKDILTGTCFDNGTICSSEQAVVVERQIDSQVRERFAAEGAYFLDQEKQAALTKVVATPEGKLNAKIVGKSAKVIAEMAGLSIPEGTRALICPLNGVGKDYPLSIEKLSPILAYYVVENLEEGCNRATEVLRYGGMGHTASIHTGSRDAARDYGLRMPVSRVIVNSPSTHGAIGFTTDLEPSMTLGCGSWGGNVTSDNISPRHLIDVKRIAFETKAINRAGVQENAVASVASVGRADIDRAAIAELVDRFLQKRKFNAPQPTQPPPAIQAPTPALQPIVVQVQPPPVSQPPQTEVPQSSKVLSTNHNQIYDFVCEDDVRRAIKSGEKIHINSKTIVTPAARDLGEEKDVFAR